MRHKHIIASTALLVFGLQTQAQTLPAPPVSPAPVTNYEYDANGNPTKVIQAPGVSGFNFATTNTYDALNRVKDSTDARAGVTRFGYNGRTDLTQVTDPRNLLTQYPRNGLGDATQLVSPDTGTASHGYDEAGNLKTRTDSRGALGTYSYDALNRPTQVVYTLSGQSTQTYGWTYDQTGAGYANGIGRLTSTSHPSGATQYTYDAQGRVLTDTQRVSAATGANPSQISNTVTYGYDSGGRLVTLQYPSGRTLSIGYDAAGQPTSLALAPTSGGTPATLVSAIQWEPFGGVKSWLWQMAGGTQLHERIRDGYGRIVRYRLGNTIRDVTYDAADRITGYTHYDASTAATQPTLGQGFGYDELGRLNSITTASASWSIGYDANGNRTSLTLNAATSSYTTEATSNRLTGTSNPARSLAYDNAGNTTSDSGNAYSAGYDAAGRLATLTKAGITTTYGYDAQGRRVRKYNSTGAASTIVFVYDQQGLLLGEYDQNGTAIREYVWLGSTPIAMFTPDPANGANPPLVYYFHTDHLNTPRMLVDTAGNQRWNWIAEPFGTTAPNENPQSLGTLTQPLRFPGQYADSESGLFYNMARFYDASGGRYTSSDPIGLSGGINTYAYVGGDPVSYVDPNGLQAITIPAPMVSSMVRPSVGTLVDPLVSPSTSPNDPNNGSESDKCRNLRKKVENLRTEVFDKRIPDLAANPGQLPRRIGPGEALRDTIRGHEKLLNRQWRRLNELEDEYIKECGC
jgi:RHS repeat-associated protein